MCSTKMKMYVALRHFGGRFFEVIIQRIVFKAIFIFLSAGMKPVAIEQISSSGLGRG